MKTTFAWPDEPRECPRCHGEGYFYRRNHGRGVMNPIEEFKCGGCNGTGLVDGPVGP